MCVVRVRNDGAKVSKSDFSHIEKTFLEAMSVFDFDSATCDVVLRESASRSSAKRVACEATVRVPGATIRVSEYASDARHAARDVRNKVSRKLRRRKTQLVDKRRNEARETSNRVYRRAVTMVERDPELEEEPVRVSWADPELELDCEYDDGVDTMLELADVDMRADNVA